MSLKNRIKRIEKSLGMNKEEDYAVTLILRYAPRKDGIALMKDGRIYENAYLMPRGYTRGGTLSPDTEEGRKKFVELGYKIISHNSPEYREYREKRL